MTVTAEIIKRAFPTDQARLVEATLAALTRSGRLRLDARRYHLVSR